MRALIFMMLGICMLTAHADPGGAGALDDPSADREDTQAIVHELPDDPEEPGSDQSGESAESPWQGTWTGSEMDPTGTRVSVTARIVVTNGTISGTWRARGRGSRPITGQVNGKEASITILQGGSKISATLVEKNKFEYRGLRGFGTLQRQ
jgi:hypothetical protein